MQSQSLDRLIQFQRADLVNTGFGQSEVWGDHGAPHMASKKDLTDGERWRAGEVAAHVTTRFVVRYSPFTLDITPRDRLVCEGVTYNITGKKELAGRRQGFELTCAARADQ